jgi:flagella basal body P-ring formation protein FlgA
LEQNGNKGVCALVNLRVRMFGRVPTTARELRPGDALDDGAWTWEQREWTSALPVEASKPEQWQGMIVRQHLRVGQVLDARMFKAPPLVRKNEMVSVLLEDNYLKIEGRGTALSDASKNESVAVLLEGAERPVIGRAAGPGRITVR